MTRAARPTLLGVGLAGGSTTAAESLTRSTAPARTAATPPATTGPVRATLTASTHRPRVNADWTYVVRVRDAAGRPIRARVHLQVLFGVVPVGQIGTHWVIGGVA
jgi:hypothetical protein